jgi:hydroxyethylthiazole kinase-like uncharacterized protein yjeF
MGLGTKEPTIKAFKDFLKQMESPIVVDADGLNILAMAPDMLKDVPPQSIFTPHPKELERLIGTWKDDFEKLEKAKAFSISHDIVLVIKGAHTIILYKGKGYVNTTGNPGMATAGSGDVLTGMVTGLMAQGYTSLQAAIFGVYLHGLAGDISASQKGYEALKASDIVNSIGRAYVEILSPPDVEEKEQG